MVDVQVQGMVADGFEGVREAFARNFAERGELGAAVAVHRDGRPVVDLWAGSTDPAVPDRRDWASGTAAVVRSVTKGLTAAVPHLLHQRGRLDLDAPVGTYWPEFKANGKDGVLVRHLLAHRAGLPAPDRPLTPAESLDGRRTARAMEAQQPLWEPGTAHGYHPHTYGWLLGELILRATGRSLGRWFDEEIAQPLGLGLWIGLPETETWRVARLGDAPAPPPSPAQGLRVRPKPEVTRAWADPGSLTRRAFGAVTPAADENDPAFRAAGLPASGAVGTARALSRCYASFIGEVDLPDGRRRLFAPATLTQARSQESHGADRVLLVHTRFGLGYMLHGPACPMLGPGSFGHPGRGGSLAFADPESGVSFAYVTNGMQSSVTSDPRPQALIRALRGCLEAAA